MDAQFEDVVHEITVSSVLLKFFDHGTLQLEVPIPGTAKNSDVGGSRSGLEYRVEATVVHEEWPPIPNNGLKELMESVELPVGYSVLLRHPVQYESEAQAVVAAIRELHEKRDNITDDGLNVAGGTAWPTGDPNRFVLDAGPIFEITFLDDNNVRWVQPPAYTRSTMEKSEREQMPRLKGVMTLGDLNIKDPTHSDHPLSTKLWQAVDKKRAQCAAGVVNIVAISQTRPMDDRSLEDALYGVAYAAYDVSPTGEAGEAKLYRKGSGPFTPEQHSENVSQFVDPFRLVSAVWAIRRSSGHSLSTLYQNPNATVPVPDGDKTALEALGLSRCRD